MLHDIRQSTDYECIYTNLIIEEKYPHFSWSSCIYLYSKYLSFTCVLVIHTYTHVYMQTQMHKLNTYRQEILHRHTFSTRPPKSQGGINVILDLDQSIKHHRTT